MPLVENLLNRLNLGRSRKEAPGQQLSIILWDLRGMTEEERHGFDPGFYFIVAPVTSETAQQQDFLENLTPYFAQIINDQGFNEGEGFKKPVSEDGRYVVTPTWMYTEEGYYQDLHALVVRAKPLEPKVLENIPVDYEIKQALSDFVVEMPL